MKRYIALVLAAVLSAGCTAGNSDFETYADSEGNVWIVSDCPNTDQTLSGNPDGLPHVSSVQTREEIEAWYGTGENSVVVPRNGEAWDRAADGSVVILDVEDFMIEVTLDDANQCPSMPSMNNGVPIIYRIATDATSISTSPPSAQATTTTSTSAISSTTSTTTQVTSTPTLPESEASIDEFTVFTASTACDPSAEDANLQVIQAFTTAYNDHDQARLAELFPIASPIIADMSGIPHLAEDDWNDVNAWAAKGWSVDDQFVLTRLLMYESGSVFDLERSNDVLRTKGVESLRHLGKVHSSNCAISQIVLYLPTSDNPNSSECLYWKVFDNELSEGTTQNITTPEACSATRP